MSDIAEKVKSIVVEHLGVEKEKVIESASFVEHSRSSEASMPLNLHAPN